MKFRYFSGRLALFLGLFATLLALFSFSLLSRNAEDLLAYQKLMETEDPNLLEKAGYSYKAKQKREGLQKDLFFSHKNERLQLHLVSQEAELILDHRQEATEIVEQMKQVKCCMQEELFYLLEDGREALLQEDGRLLVRQGDPKNPLSRVSLDARGVKPMQVVRFLEADEACYHYKRQLFEAKNVKISRYILEGHQLVEEVREGSQLMNGVADRVQFSLSGKELNFKAAQLKAQFYPSKRVFSPL